MPPQTEGARKNHLADVASTKRCKMPTLFADDYGVANAIYRKINIFSNFNATKLSDFQVALNIMCVQVRRKQPQINQGKIVN